MLEEKRNICCDKATLDVILHHIISSNAAGSVFEMCPLDEKTLLQLCPKQVSKDHVCGLLFNLGCIVNYGGAMCVKRDLTTWNNFMSSDNEDFEFTVRGKNRVMCLHIKRILQKTDERLLTEEQLQIIENHRIH